MKRVLQVTLVLLAVLVGMSIYPGIIASTIFSLFGFISLLPLLGLWFLFVAVAAVRDVVQRRSLRSAFALQAAAISLFAFALVVLRVPLRVGFLLSRPAFERFIQTATVRTESERRSHALSRWFGIYRTDRWGMDSRGGTYFRTGTGADMIDEMSYGFVFQPNHEGTPFGAAHYIYSRVFGEWHTFYVSDDYY